MRILAVTPYAEPEGGGLERYAQATLTRLAARGHDVRQLCFTAGEARTEERDGVHVTRLRPLVRLSNTPIHPGFRREVTRIMQDWNPAVLVAHTPVPFPAEMAALAARRAGVPLVVTYHAGKLDGGTLLLDTLASLDRATLERRMLAQAKRLIAVSPFVRDAALAAHRSKVTVIPPGVEPYFVPGSSPSGPSILFVGPLRSAYTWKGLDVLLEAFPRVRARVPDARLLLVGDGDRMAELRAKAAGAGLAESIEFLGRVSQEGLVRAYQRAGVVVLPSTSPAESFGMCLSEGNACGKPVVGSRIGGIPDFVRQDQNGFLAEPGDHVGLASAIACILENPALAERLGREGRRRVLAEHDWEKLTDATEDVLLAAAGKATRPRRNPPADATASAEASREPSHKASGDDLELIA